jgi:hypothetical protein
LATLEHKASGGGYGLPIAGEDGGGTSRVATGNGARAAAAPAARAAAATASVPAPAPAPAPVDGEATPAPAGASVANLTDTASWWPDVLRAASADAPLRPMLAGLAPLGVTDNRITLASPHAAMFTDRSRAAVQRHVEAVTGVRLAIDVRAADVPAEPAPSPVVGPAPTLDDDLEHVPTDIELATAEAAGEPEVAPATTDAPVLDDDGLDLFQTAFDATELPSNQ